MKKLPQFTFSVSHTTRSPRTGETDGVHYHFSDTETVKSMIEKGEFLEYAEVHGNYYGTSYSSLQSDSIAVLDIDVQGVKKVKKAVEEVSSKSRRTSPRTVSHLVASLLLANAIGIILTATRYARHRESWGLLSTSSSRLCPSRCLRRV